MAQGPNGVRVLLAPISPELADSHPPTTTSHGDGELRKTFDYVVVDTSHTSPTSTSRSSESAQHILVSPR